MAKHDDTLQGYVLATFGCVVTAITLAILNLFDLGMFYCTMKEFVDKYFTSTTPEMTTSAIMFSTLYTINTLTLGYILITSRYYPKHCLLNLQPNPTPKSFYVYWMMSFLCSISWSLNYHYDRIIFCWVVQVVACIALWKAYSITIVIVKENEQKYKAENPLALWLTQYFLHNAVVFYAIWSFVTSIVSLGSVLVYVNSFGKPTADLRGIWTMEEGSAIGLLVFLAYTVGVLLVELHTHEQYFRHVFAITPAFVVSWGGLVTRMFLERRGLNLAIGVIGFSVSILGLMYKLFLNAVEAAKEKGSFQRPKLR